MMKTSSVLSHSPIKKCNSKKIVKNKNWWGRLEPCIMQYILNEIMFVHILLESHKEEYFPWGMMQWTYSYLNCF